MEQAADEWTLQRCRDNAWVDETEVEASIAYAKKAALTLLGGAVVFALVTVVTAVAAFTDTEPTRGLAALASFFSLVVSVTLFVTAGRARRAYFAAGRDEPPESGR